MGSPLRPDARSRLDGSRIVTTSFRHVRPHPDGFDLRFRDEEVDDALAELRLYRESWQARLDGVLAELEEVSRGAAQPSSGGGGRIVGALRSRLRPSPEVVRLRYQAEDLKRSLGNIDDAIRRLEEYAAERAAMASVRP